VSKEGVLDKNLGIKKVPRGGGGTPWEVKKPVTTTWDVELYKPGVEREEVLESTIPFRALRGQKRGQRINREQNAKTAHGLAERS